MPETDNQLGATIRSWRDRLSPAAVGLPVGAVRRSPGLRREELADLAGISVDYLVRLEQGRATAPSDQVVNSLARALQLSTEERDHLFRLAHLNPPDDGLVIDHLPPGMQRLLGRLGDTPVAVFAADWRLVWWNHAWAGVFGDPSAIPLEERSLVRVRFPVAGDRGRLTAWPVIPANRDGADRGIVADLRRALARYPSDPRLSSLVAHTLAGNARFAEFWADGAVGVHAEDQKTIEHPSVGTITVDCDVLTDGATDLKVVAYTAAAGSEDETKLKLASIAGVMPAST